jgi:hypothetical protein
MELHRQILVYYIPIRKAEIDAGALFRGRRLQVVEDADQQLQVSGLRVSARRSLERPKCAKKMAPKIGAI